MSNTRSWCCGRTTAHLVTNALDERTLKSNVFMESAAPNWRQESHKAIDEIVEAAQAGV